ncbi:hypothetical protein COLO4_11990 [Corchorus olitorius]|uniref:Uncharacterized protein n=1 Tax=Corchorus olitorius TaxID=93759 RepID=A0A1R3K2H0_9ROSI|nr:hypothetical protein COLO4_11990 [Corchorus olitorius]
MAHAGSSKVVDFEFGVSFNLHMISSLPNSQGIIITQ